jgi:hypothetical protein
VTRPTTNVKYLLASRVQIWIQVRFQPPATVAEGNIPGSLLLVIAGLESGCHFAITRDRALLNALGIHLYPSRKLYGADSPKLANDIFSAPIGDGRNPSPSGETRFGVTWSRATFSAKFAMEHELEIVPAKSHAAMFACLFDIGRTNRSAGLCNG